jgi:hypothetical protein
MPSFGEAESVELATSAPGSDFHARMVREASPGAGGDLRRHLGDRGGVDGWRVGDHVVPVASRGAGVLDVPSPDRILACIICVQNILEGDCL